MRGPGRSPPPPGPGHLVWTYLLWFSYALAGFAISRAVGHITEHVSLVLDQGHTWKILKPYSGAINTISFVVVASITLFFERIWKIYQQIARDKLALEDTHRQLRYLNRHLEDLVAARTRELTHSESKYRRIFELSRDPILVADETGVLIDFNPSAMRLLAIDSESGPDRALSLPDLLQHPGDWDKLRGELLATGFINDEELELAGRARQSLNVLLSATRENTAENRTVRFHFLLKDISQRKAMTRQLLQADKLASIGQLAAGIAHEINNPLSIILGYTQLLIRSEDAATERYGDLRTIEKHARACKTIVEDLLKFSRSTQTRKEAGSLHQAVEEVVNVVRHHFELDNVMITCELDPAVPPMVIDKEKIEQVFMNLVMNAKQAIGKNGAIQVTSRFDPERKLVTVQVKDTGGGIEARHLPRIFDPFFTTKKTGEGTGLGLSVSYGIVQHHNGEILVASEPGTGSTFSVVLPVQQSELMVPQADLAVPQPESRKVGS